MKKLFLFAAIAGFALVSASPPLPKGGPDKPEGAAYPPCSRTVTDSCNQLRERGTRTRRHHAAHRSHHARRHAAHARTAHARAAHARAAPAPAARATAAAPAARAAAGTPQERARLERIRRAGNRG